MRIGSPFRLWAAGLLLCSAMSGPAVMRGHAQAESPLVTQLLEKAHTLEVRGRIDLARQSWQQVLTASPKNTEALGGLARAAKLEGKNDEAAVYLQKLRQINPNDPNIARAENLASQKNRAAQLQEAGRLAQAGQYARAMTILRQVYGDAPPPGDAALSYYQTEAAIEEGRPHAIAGLRALVDQYPQDSRYQITLGKILTYNPKTRAEGRKLLQRHPDSPEATEALRQSLVWDAQNPATAADIRNYLTRHKDMQLATALAQTDAQAAAARRAAAKAGPPLTPEQQAAQALQRARSAEDQAAYNALNAHRISEAEERFKSILTKDPADPQALAGMGYVRMQQSNFGGAVSFLEQAIQDGSRDAGVEKALKDSRFFYTMQEATSALNENDLGTAQTRFQAALQMRPSSPEAMQGLGGTFLKAQEPEPAIVVFTEYVRTHPGDKAGWRGLFMANYGAQHYNEALAMDKRVPSAVRAQLMRDPDYLKTLASVYMALGRDADAERVLRSALELPFPADARGLKADTQLQYAGLLVAAKRYEQASALYRQVLAADTTNTDAWQGLVATEHAQGQDANALQALGSMPPQNYQAAMQQPGFETLVASIYQSQGKMDDAQGVLETFLNALHAQGKPPFLDAQLQLAGIYMARGLSQQAYPLFREILSANPDRVDAWKGLLTALHSTAHDQEALAQVQQLPPAIRQKLEQDPAYLQTVGAIYAGLGHPQEAMAFLNRIQQHYAAMRQVAPADIDIQNAWLLFNSQNDALLYRALMGLGNRADLNDEQRRTVQSIWANWSVRRANAAVQAGNYRRSLTILNAAAQAFPDNPAVTKALASGYATAGLPKQAVQIFKAQDLSSGSAADYKAAVGAALANNDLKSAETWLRFGLEQYPRDAQLLGLAAKFEQARGDANRASVFYKQSLAAMPAPDYGAELSTELLKPPPVAAARKTNPVRAQDLATLLGTPDPATPMAAAETTAQPTYSRPYLPGSTNTSIAPVPLQPQNGGYPYGAPASGLPYNPPTGTQPMYQTTPAMSGPGSSQGRQKKSRLGDYVPQSKVEGLDGVIHLHPVPAIEAVYGPYVSYDSSVETATMARDEAHAGTPVGGLHTVAFQQSTTTDGYPIVPYAATAKPAKKHQPTEAAKQRARQIRLYQENAAPQPLRGVSHPPEDNYPVQLDGAQFNAAQTQGSRVQQPPPSDGTAQYPQSKASAPRQGGSAYPRQNGARYPQSTSPSYPQSNGAAYPPSNGSQGPTETYGTYQPLQTAQPSAQPVTPYQAPVGGQSSPEPVYNSTQQYPRPATRRGTQTTPSQRRKAAARQPARPVQRQRMTTQPAPEPMQPYAPPMSYPVYAQPSVNPALPNPVQPYPLPPAPTDRDLMQQNVPPLRGYFDTRPDPRVPLSERQQTEMDLATIEGSYSGWVGGSAMGRYRSGTPGVDRLTALEIPFEVSGVAGKTARFSIVPKGVFLNSGVLDTTAGTLGSQPVLGTLPGNALNVPQQQFASGVGGEIQMVTRTLSMAGGYTPYGFLVSNVTGRVAWRPGAGHFTLYGGRDAVKQTQLSYAGLRDPGSSVSNGNIWGGVVQTGGGVRFDFGDEKSGFYVQAEGFDLSGYHVLRNRQYDGTMGAYFRVKNWPQAGSLNVGGTMFGEHFDFNERGQTYGLGGYFSPNAYFLAAVPVTFTGHHGTDLHYLISGSAGLQTFQENSQIYFPLDVPIQTGFGSNCGQPVCATFPVNSNTGLNYGLDAQGSYRVGEHWFVGAFLSGNNTNNYNTVSGGFFARYTFRPQVPTVDYPTGLFPAEGFRPLKVP